MVDEPMFSSEYRTEPCAPTTVETSEPSSLDMPGTDPIALGDAITQELRRYRTAKAQWQVITAKIIDA